MAINRIANELFSRVQKTDPAPRQFSEGQIVEGRILKLYPNQKAEIQIGSERMIAQLEAPLTIGKQYHFQVQVKDEVVCLKMIGEGLSTNSKMNATDLLNHLGLATGKMETSLVQSLIKNNIPFNKEQLVNAIRVLQSSSNPVQAERILQQMIAQQIPITKDIFTAIYMKQSNNLQEQMTEVLNHLKQLLSSNHSLSQMDPDGRTNDNSNKQMIVTQKPSLETQNNHEEKINRLQQAIRNVLDQTDKVAQTAIKAEVTTPAKNMHSQYESALVREAVLMLSRMTDQASLQKESVMKIFEQLIGRNKPLFNEVSKHFLQRESIDLKTWESTWRNFVESGFSKPTNLVTESRTLPFNLTSEQIIQSLNQVIEKANSPQAFLQKWGMLIAQSLTNQSALSSEELTRIVADFKEQVVPFLKQDAPIFKELNRPLENNFALLREMLTLPTQIDNVKHTEQLLSRVQQVLLHIKDGSFSQMVEPKELFITQLKQMTEISGLLHERMLLTNHEQSSTADSLKAVLMKLIQTGEPTTQEQIRPLIHLLNGVQIQSVQESNQLLHATLQLPGGPLGLNGDLQMKFEGRQTDNGEINADYCRVLFYLDLARLEETIIDMQVQKRMVSVTIFNDQPSFNHITKLFEPGLAKGLRALDYELTSVSLKPLHEQNNEKVKQQPVLTNEHDFKGVDYRI